MTMEFQKEWFFVVQTAVVLLKEHVFRSSMKIVTLLADSTKMPKMMNVLLTEGWVHLIMAVRTIILMSVA